MKIKRISLIEYFDKIIERLDNREYILEKGLLIPNPKHKGKKNEN